MTYYEKGEHYIQEKHTKDGYCKETLDEEKWQRGTPIYVRNERLGYDNARLRSPASFDGNTVVRIPAKRIVDDYSRTDYGYQENDKTFIRRPASVHSSAREEPNYYNAYNNNNNNNNNCYKNSAYSHRGSQSEMSSPNQPEKLTSRPGSPGPVAGTGDIINTEHGFTIQLDVKHFKPDEIKVVLKDELLCVSGERIEECGDGQTLRRSFSRKYSIPVDIHLDSIRSHLADNGFLVINGSRRGWKETNLSVHPNTSHRSGSVISTV